MNYYRILVAVCSPKAQVLKNNTMGRSLALALQKVSIPRPTSAHRALLINYFLEQVRTSYFTKPI